MVFSLNRSSIATVSLHIIPCWKIMHQSCKLKFPFLIELTRCHRDQWRHEAVGFTAGRRGLNSPWMSSLHVSAHLGMSLESNRRKSCPSALCQLPWPRQSRFDASSNGWKSKVVNSPVIRALCTRALYRCLSRIFSVSGSTGLRSCTSLLNKAISSL